MENTPISGLTLYYDPGESEAVDQLAIACEQSVQTITSNWQLAAPQDCRVYLLTSWPRCVFQGAPFGSQILLGITLPLWYREFKTRWHYAGGWSKRYGTRQVVGIKAPRLIAQSPDPMGESIFIKEENLQLKVLSIVCHELTHAFSSHLALPTWINEGLAMVSADKCMDKPTVRLDTLQILRDADYTRGSAEQINLKTQSREQIIFLYVRGYWLTRYLAEIHPQLVVEFLSERLDHTEIESKISAALDIPQNKLWQEIDQVVLAHYSLEMT